MNILTLILPRSKLYRIEIFMDESGKWRWRVRHLNTEKLATSQGYSSLSECVTTATNFGRDRNIPVVKEPHESTQSVPAAQPV